MAPVCHAQPVVHLDIDTSVYASDNPFLLSGGDTGAMAFDIAARPGLNWQVAHATTLDVESTARFRQYHRRYGNFMTGRIATTVRHRDSEYLSARGGIGFARELPLDGIADSSDGAIDPRTLRNIWSADAALDWRPNAITLIQGTLNAQRTQFSDRSILLPTNGYNAALSLSRNLNARFAVGGRAALAISDARGFETLSAKTLQLTGTYRANETLRATVMAGIEWADGRLPDGTPRPSSPRFSGSAMLCEERR